MKKIIVKLQGGLGNQIFQYSYAKMLANKYCIENIILDTSYFNRKHIRSLSFDKYILPDNVEFCNKSILIYDFIYNIYKVLDKIYFKINEKHLFFSINFLKRGFYFGRNSIVEDSSLKKLNELYIGGYFQNENAMKLVYKEVDSNLKIKNDVSDLYEKYKNEINNSINSIGVSVRIGADYKKFGWPICSRSFYENGVKIITKKIGNSKIFIFSDCIDIIKKEKWFDSDNFVFVEGCSDVESLNLLRLCQNFVIANSTFSWWGAYFGKNMKKIIVAPEFFYSNKKMFESEINIPNAIYLNNENGLEVRK